MGLLWRLRGRTTPLTPEESVIVNIVKNVHPAVVNIDTAARVLTPFGIFPEEGVSRAPRSEVLAAVQVSVASTPFEVLAKMPDHLRILALQQRRRVPVSVRWYLSTRPISLGVQSSRMLRSKEELISWRLHRTKRRRERREAFRFAARSFSVVISAVWARLAGGAASRNWRGDASTQVFHLPARGSTRSRSAPARQRPRGPRRRAPQAAQPQRWHPPPAVLPSPVQHDTQAWRSSPLKSASPIGGPLPWIRQPPGL
jgi:hypothetical protein